ncbi:MAG: YIP1 family protein [Carboxylicivirga sp.]|jgi:hypothetical protein|nr:YIP1 family protein [Carboxylicivirga sp.]
MIEEENEKELIGFQTESTQDAGLSDKELFIKIWISPREAFKYINDNKFDKFLIILLVLAGITRTFDRASLKSMGDNMSLIAVITSCIVFGALLGWITYYLYAAMLSWTGKWLNGQGNTKSILRMTAYSMIPSILSLVLLVPQVALFGNGIFQSEMDLYENNLLASIVFYFCLVLEIIFSIWTIVIFVIGISEVQKLSIGKSILNMILPGIILISFILLIVFVIRTFG